MSQPPRKLTERSFQFALELMGLCRQLETTPGVTRLLVNQLFRSGTSIGANIEEAQGAQSPADYLAKYYIALKEARETKYWLRLLAVSGLVQPEAVGPLLLESDQLIAILTSIVKKLKVRRDSK